MNPADLRGILTYIPRFRDKTFVLNIDSAVLTDDNFRNLLLDILVLRSLNIKVVIVHGASVGIHQLAGAMNAQASNLDGIGVTDEATLKLSILASAQLSHELLEGLSEVDLKAAVTNAIVAHPAGILHGQDYKWTGKVVRVQTDLIQDLLQNNVVPVIPPLGFDGEGRSYRINSDSVALEVAEALQAAKLIFVTTCDGINGGGKLSTQYSVSEAEDLLKKKKSDLAQDLFSKLNHAVQACRNGVLRAHIIDGRRDEALLSEIFSPEGVGTMIYSNEYASIRRARKKDVRAILRLMRKSVANQEVVARTQAELSQLIEEFYVFEIDRNIVGCVAVHSSADKPEVAEMACLLVSEAHANQGIGRKLMEFAEARAKESGFKRLLALSTQAFNYFQAKGGFKEGDPDMLPAARRARYDGSGRNSKVLFKDLG